MTEEINAIHNELEQLQAQQEALRAALIEKQEAAKAGVLEQITQLAQSVGMTGEEVAAHFVKPKRAKAEKLNGTAKPRAVWRDTVTGGEYKGGKIPGWLADRLNTTGMTLDAYREAGHMARVQ